MFVGILLRDLARDFRIVSSELAPVACLTRSVRARSKTVGSHLITKNSKSIQKRESVKCICFSPCDDRDNRPKQFLWLKLLHTSYSSPLNQLQNGRILYSVDKYFETKGDLRNFCVK